MSAIPPQFPQVRPAAPTPASRADFFKTVLAGVQAGPSLSAPAAAAAPSRPAAATPTVPEDRPARPGALLDIRV